MVRLIQKSGYIKPGSAGGYMKYIATRERVEKLERTMDAIRSKYGQGALTVAALAPREGPEDGLEAERALPF